MFVFSNHLWVTLLGDGRLESTASKIESVIGKVFSIVEPGITPNKHFFWPEMVIVDFIYTAEQFKAILFVSYKSMYGGDI